jgi:putative DNA primase/helicase
MADKMKSTSGKKLIVVRADKITPKKLRWLWPQRIPLGKITVFGGSPGIGKGLASIDVAARVTTGRDYHDVGNPMPASDVLILSGEDDAEDALIPRLTAAGADLSKVQIIQSVRVSVGEQMQARDLHLDEDVGAIEKKLRDFPATRLIIIDPISDHLGSKKMWAEQEMRELLGPLKKLAQKYEVSVVCVMHPNKKEGLSAIYRIGGAVAFVGVARANWLFTKHPDYPSNSYMLPLKNNYAPDSLRGLAYRIKEQLVQIEGSDEPIPRVEWLGEADIDANEALAPPQKKHAPSRADAKAFLSSFLGAGPQDASAVYTAANAQGISQRTLDRAKAELGIESRKKGSEGWEWVLPDGQSKDANASKGESGTVGSLQHASSRE